LQDSHIAQSVRPQTFRHQFRGLVKSVRPALPVNLAIPSKFRFAVSPLNSFVSAATSFSGSSGGFCASAAAASTNSETPSVKTVRM